MSEFERDMPTYRLVQTHHGDDLQAVAARELGDSNRWPELVWINQLSHPYLTDDPQRVAAGVLLNGSQIRVPAPAGFRENKTGNDDIYERDCLLRGRLLQVDDGDFMIASGVDNLTQQLSHAINTPRGQQRRHPEYGCLVWRLKGRAAGPAAGMLGSEYVKATLEADYRVVQVPKAVATVSGDVVSVTAEAEAVAGGTVLLQAGTSTS